MSRSWNGESLVNELSALLGDTSDAFKSRVLGWLNDVLFEISARHDWGHLLEKGKKYLVSEKEIHSLEIESPIAPKVELLIGGSLAAGSVYKVLLTYVQENGVETLSGIESAALTTTATNKTIKVSDIPTSRESLVTGRNVYLKKDSGAFYLHTKISDNFTTDLTITTDTALTIEPPDYEAIKKLKGAPFFEDSRSNYLEYRDLDQLRKLAQGQWPKGNPEFYSQMEPGSITTYPIPSEDMEVSFNYYRNPRKLYNSKDSQPDFPIFLKPALKAGVVALGYEYRDRAGAEIKKANYENAILDAINRGGRVANIEYSVRDVYGNTDGHEVGH